MVIEQWTKSANDQNPVPWNKLGQWQLKLQHFRDEMSQLNTMEDIIDKSEEYYATTRSHDADVLTAESFIEIPAVITGIPRQFDVAIMEPFQTMPTPSPTPSPISQVLTYIPLNSICLRIHSLNGECSSHFVPDSKKMKCVHIHNTLCWNYWLLTWHCFESRCHVTV